MTSWTFKILYDGDCPICQREVRWLERRNRLGRLAFEDIAAPEFDASRIGIPQSELMGVIHGVFPDGRVVSRVEVFRQAYHAVGLGWLVAPTGWPGLRWIFDRLYELFARNRMRIGGWLGRSCESGCDVPTSRSERDCRDDSQ